MQKNNNTYTHQQIQGQTGIIIHAGNPTSAQASLNTVTTGHVQFNCFWNKLFQFTVYTRDITFSFVATYKDGVKKLFLRTLTGFVLTVMRLWSLRVPAALIHLTENTGIQVFVFFLLGFPSIRFPCFLTTVINKADVIY